MRQFIKDLLAWVPHNFSLCGPGIPDQFTWLIMQLINNMNNNNNVMANRHANSRLPQHVYLHFVS